MRFNLYYTDHPAKKVVVLPCYIDSVPTSKYDNKALQCGCTRTACTTETSIILIRTFFGHNDDYQRLLGTIWDNNTSLVVDTTQCLITNTSR